MVLGDADQVKEKKGRFFTALLWLLYIFTRFLTAKKRKRLRPFVLAPRTRCAFPDAEPCDKAPRPFGPPRRKVPCGNVCPCSRQSREQALQTFQVKQEKQNQDRVECLLCLLPERVARFWTSNHVTRLRAPSGRLAAKFPAGTFAPVRGKPQAGFTNVPSQAGNAKAGPGRSPRSRFWLPLLDLNQ